MRSAASLRGRAVSLPNALCEASGAGEHAVETLLANHGHLKRFFRPAEGMERRRGPMTPGRP